MLKTRVLLTLLLCLWSVGATAAECGPVESNYIFQRKTIQHQQLACYKKVDGISFYRSKNCLAKVTCPLLKLVNNSGLGYEAVFDPSGSPGFNLCHSLKLIPRIEQINIKGEWKTLTVCYTEDFKTFANADMLLLHWRKITE